MRARRCRGLERSRPSADGPSPAEMLTRRTYLETRSSPDSDNAAAAATFSIAGDTDFDARARASAAARGLDPGHIIKQPPRDGDASLALDPNDATRSHGHARRSRSTSAAARDRGRALPRAPRGRAQVAAAGPRGARRSRRADRRHNRSTSRWPRVIDARHRRATRAVASVDGRTAFTCRRARSRRRLHTATSDRPRRGLPPQRHHKLAGARCRRLARRWRAAAARSRRGLLDERAARARRRATALLVRAERRAVTSSPSTPAHSTLTAAASPTAHTSSVLAVDLGERVGHDEVRRIAQGSSGER